MKINSISNQSFGKLKITAGEDGKKARELYACTCPFERWERIDKLSGKTPVTLDFDASYNADVTFLSCKIKNKIFLDAARVDGPKDFQKKLDLIEEELHRQRNIETAHKYFA